MSLPVPIAYWPFNEGVGTTAADASGNGHTATLVNATWDTTLRKFGAAALSNADVGVGATISSFNVGTVYSISFWINGWGGTNDGLMLGGATEFYGCYINSTGTLFHSSGASNYVQKAHGGLTGSHHLTIVRNGASVTFYKDGVSLGATTLPNGSTANTFTTLNGYANNTFQLVATIDDLRVYDVALTAVQVSELYALVPISLVASVTQIRGSASAAIDTTGATLLVACTANAFAAATITDSKSNTWLPLSTHIGGGNGYHRIYYCLPAVVGTGHTFTPAGSYASAIIYAFSGVTAYQTESGNGIGSSSTGPIACGSVTPSQNGALIISGLAANAFAVDTISPAGFAQQTIANGAGSHLQNSAAYYIQPTAAAIDPTWTWSGGTHDYTGASAAVFLETVPVTVPTVVSSSSGRALTTNTITVSHTVPAGTNRYLVVLCNVSSALGTPVATYGGVSLTKTNDQDCASGATGPGRLLVFELANPAVGTANVVISGSGSGLTLCASVISLTGCNAMGPLVTAEGNSATATVTVASAVNQLVFDACACGGTASVDYTAGAGQTSITEQDGLTGTSRRLATSYKTGAGSVTVSWTLAPGSMWLHGALSAKYVDVTTKTDQTVVLLIGAEQDVIDESPLAKTLTLAGHAGRTTTQAKYGTYSLTFDGTGDWVQTPNHADFQFGSGNFTVEGWFRHSKTNNDMLGQWANAGGVPGSSWFLYITGGSLTFRGAIGSGIRDVAYSWTPTLGQWYHIAADRSGETVRLYIDGAVVATDTGFAGALNTCTDPFTLGAIGATNAFPTNNYSGQMDEIRVTKGVARYAGAFTPPINAFPRGISHVNRVQNTPVTTGLHSVSTPSAVNYIGNLLAVYAYYQTNGTPSATSTVVTDTAGNTYTLAKEVVNGNYRAQVWYALNCAEHPANVTTLTCNGSSQSGYLAISVRQFSGITSLIGVNGAFGSSTLLNSGLLPVDSSQDTLIFAAIETDSQSFVSPGPGYTANWFGTTGAPAYFADEFKLVTVTEAATATCGNSPWLIAAASFAAGAITLVTVPNVVGQTEAAATATLTSAGLIKATGLSVYHPTIPAGSVIAQVPAAGGSIPSGSVVTLKLSLGVSPSGIYHVAEAHGYAQSATTATITTPVDTTGATILILDAGWQSGNTSSTVTVTDTNGNTWIPLPMVWFGICHKMHYCLNPIVGTGHTFTVVGPAASWPGFHVYAFSGVASCQTHRSGTVSGGTSLVIAGVSPGLDGALILTGITPSSAAADAVSSGYGPVAQITGTSTQTQVSAAWQIQTTAATVVTTWSRPGPITANIPGDVLVCLPFFKGTPVAGEIALIGAVSVQEELLPGTGSGNYTVTTSPLDTTGANLLVMWVATWVNWGTVFDSKGNLWVETPRHNSGNNEGRFFYCSGAIVGPNHTFSFKDVDDLSGIVYAFSGTGGLQVEIGAASAALPLATGSVTPNSNKALILSGLSSGGSADSVAGLTPAGFKIYQVERSGNQMKAAVGWQTQATAAPINPTWTAASGSFSNVAVQTLVFIQGTGTGDARVAQLPLEVLVQSDAVSEIRLAQLPLEVLTTGASPTVKLSQLAAEVMLASTSASITAKLSQAAVEVMLVPSSTLPAKLSQVAVEVLIRPGPPSTTGGVNTVWLGSGGVVWIE